MFEANFGYVKILDAIAVIGDAVGLGGDGPVGLQVGKAHIKAIIQKSRAGGVGGRSQTILGEGHPGTPNAFGLNAITVIKITVGGMDAGGRQGGQTETSNSEGRRGNKCGFHYLMFKYFNGFLQDGN